MPTPSHLGWTVPSASPPLQTTAMRCVRHRSCDTPASDSSGGSAPIRPGHRLVGMVWTAVNWEDTTAPRMKEHPAYNDDGKPSPITSPQPKKESKSSLCGKSQRLRCKSIYTIGCPITCHYSFKNKMSRMDLRCKNWGAINGPERWVSLG